jgi:hypothetical protein
MRMMDGVFALSDAREGGRFYLPVPAAAAAAITPAFSREERPVELLVAPAINRAYIHTKVQGEEARSEDWLTVIAILPTSPCNWIITCLYNIHDFKVICCI